MMTKVFNNAEQLAKDLANHIAQEITLAASENRRFCIALSGGSTPNLLYKKLASPNYSKIPWHCVHVFWGDERMVPYNDERNNATAAFHIFLNHVSIPPNQVHRVHTEDTPEAAKNNYDKLLGEYFDGNAFTFDLTLLGMGTDGHTLSLFPTDADVNSPTPVRIVKKSGEDILRISLSADFVNHSKEIIAIVTGKEKAGVLKEVQQGANKYPIELINREKLVFYLDSDAAASLA
jgi:6-phosphogluconolactonase